MTNILIVDDVDFFRKDLKKVAYDVFCDANIIEASSYEEAIDAIQSNSFEIVITDIKINSTNDELNQGLLIARYAKSRNNLTEVIVVTSYLNDQRTSLAITRCGVNIKLFDRRESSFLQNMEIQLSLINTQSIALLTPEGFWEQILQDRDKFSYWILFMNGFDIGIDRMIAGEVLIWQASMAKFESVFHPYQLPDKGFIELCKEFEIEEFPSLIVSDSKYMKQFIRVKPKVLLKLITHDETKNTGVALRSFLTKIHVQLRNDVSITSIKRKMQTKEYWDWVVWGANEFKDDIIKLIT